MTTNTNTKAKQDSAREAFLAERMTGIGGSDVAAILGISPWATPLDVYHSKLGIGEDRENFAMRRGLLLEPLILDEFENQTGLTVVRDVPTMRHPEHDYMIANLDGFVVTADGTEGVEAKSAGSWISRDEWGEEGTDEVPQYYLTQVHHYLAVTGWKRWHLTVWFGIDEARRYVIERDEDIVAGLIEVEGKFWFENVLPQVPPAPVNVEDQRKLWSTPTAGKAVELDAGTQYHIGCMALLQQEAKRLDEEIEAHRFAIQQAMQDAEVITNAEGKPVASWKSVTSTRLDTKALRADAPTIAADYSKPTTYRRFTITKAGKALDIPTYGLTAAELAAANANTIEED